MNIEWLSTLNYMKNFMWKFYIALRRTTNLEPLEVYMQSALTCFYSAYKEEAYREVLSNPLLEEVVVLCKYFIDATNKLCGTVQSIFGETILHSVKGIESFMRISRKKSFLILCDCLSLPEYIYFFIRSASKTSYGDVFFMMNPGGKTKTFEYLAKNYLNLSYLEEPSLEDIAKGLTRKLNCSGYMLFREIDSLVHRFENTGFTGIQDMIEIFYKHISNLEKNIEVLSTDYIVLLLTDHGYDVMLKTGRIYPYHRWSGGPSLSIIAPVLISGVKDIGKT